MTHDEERLFLINYLLKEREDYKGIRIPADENEQFRLLRSLMNVRRPEEIGNDFLEVQDSFLQEETRRKGIHDVEDMKEAEPGIILFQGDITTLRCDAIVNAANSGMTGCYHPCHGCIDNIIHTYAGVQLRLECDRIIKAQKREEDTGEAKITSAWNLPCRHVIHTVGPIVHTEKPTKKNCEELKSCYNSCLALAREHNLSSIAFCCISTGEFHFPQRDAARIAVDTVRAHLATLSKPRRIIFNVFKDSDREIYQGILGKNC